MSNRTRSTILQVVGVAALAFAAWRRLVARGDGDVGSIVLVAVLLLVVIGGGVWLWSRRDDSARKQVVAARPGWRTQAVWADATLGATLAALGAAAGKVRGGTRLTLAWSVTHVEVWRGEAVLTSLPWHDVVAIRRTIGQAASTGNPAVELVTGSGASVVVVPTRTPAGGMLPASGGRVDELVGELSAARDAAAARQAPPTP